MIHKNASEENQTKTKEQIGLAKKRAQAAVQARKERKEAAQNAVAGGSAVPRGICMQYWARGSQEDQSR